MSEFIPCPTCGRPISEDAFSCPQCGHKLGNWERIEQGSLMGKIIVAVILFSMAGCSVWLCGGL